MKSLLTDLRDDYLRYVEHFRRRQGERPMPITWRVHHPMPAELFEVMKVAAG